MGVKKWFQKLLLQWETRCLLQELQENAEYQDWLEQELANAKVRRILLLAASKK